MKKIINSFVLALAVLVFATQSAFAATANLKFYTSETDPKTGSFVELDLKVDGNKKTPYYTYVVNLEYDSAKLKFEGVTYGEGWVGVEPEAKTDIEKGIVKRVAGYPSGADKLMTIMKYKFKALAPGKADVKITGETALDGENASAQLQNKKITLNISGNALAEEIAALQNQNVTLNIMGDNSVVSTSPYTFKIEHVLQNPKTTSGTTSVTVFDINGQKVMGEDRAFNISSNSILDFSIPGNALVAGNYTISAESQFSGQSASNKQTKDIVVTGEVASIPTDSDNVFVNIGNGLWNSIVNNWIGIVGLILIVGILRYLWGRTRRYRRYDGR
jgi:hypothetical protein